MSERLADATDAEWAVLERLWEEGPAPVRRLAEVLYPGGGPSEYATVHKLLERLETKGYVRRERRGGLFVFSAHVKRDDVLGQQLETLVEKMCGGSLQPLLSHLVRAKRLTPWELRELRDLVDELANRTRGKKGS